MKSVFDLLRQRPKKETFDPHADKPIDQTDGSAPYVLPPELIHELAGKSEEEISVTLSKFRTELSEHRTRLSEHRTDLSEHRTDLSDYRTELSGERTQMSEHRTALSDSRSHLANERTHLAYVRTGVSLMSFGITLNRFAIFLAEDSRLPQQSWITLRMHSTEQIGLVMVVLGVGFLLWSLHRYRVVKSEIDSGDVKPPQLSLTLLTLAIIAFGAVTAIVLMLV
jgi:putative membrane protein